MRMLETIVMATDLGPVSPTVGRVAGYLGEVFESDLHLLHVLDSVHPPGALRDQERNVAREKLDELREELANTWHPMSLPTRMEVGSVSDRIASYAEARDANLVVLGANGGGGRRLGVTAELIAREGVRSVWIVNDDAPPSHFRIVCPVDLSPGSRQAFRNAVHLARSLQAKLVVLSVVEPSPFRVPLGQDDPAEAMVRREIELQRFVSRFDMDSVDWESQVRVGRPDHWIREEVEPWDLLVMKTSTRRRVSRLFLGSVARRVLAGIPCSVLMLGQHDVFRLSLDDAAGNFPLLCRQGHWLLDNGYSREAVGLFRSAVEIDPHSAVPWRGLALAYDRLDNESGSEACRERARDIDRHLEHVQIEAEIRGRHGLFGSGAAAAGTIREATRSAG